MPDFSRELAAALSALHTSAFAEAQALCRAILERCPDQPQALHLLGLAASKTGDGDQALSLLARARELDPDNAGLHYNYALALSEAQHTEAALDAAGRAVALAPGHLPASLLRARLLLGLGRRPEAAAAFAELLDRQPGEEDALTGLAEAGAPPAVRAYYQGEHLRCLGQAAAAQEAYAEALRQNPDYAPALLRAAQARLEQGQADAALALLARHSQRDSDLRVCLTAAKALLALNRTAEAAAAFRHCLTLAPADLEAREALASLQFRQGDPDCMTHFRELASRRWRDPDALRQRSRILQQTVPVGAFRQALMQAQRRIAGWLVTQPDRPDRPWVLHLQQLIALQTELERLSQTGQPAQEAGSYAEAGPQAFRAAELAPFGPEAAQLWLRYAELLAVHCADLTSDLASEDQNLPALQLPDPGRLAEAEGRFRAYFPPFTVLDDLLPAEAAEALWRHCQLLPVDQDFWSLPGSLCAGEREGLLTARLWQLAEGLRAGFSGLMDGLQLQQIWLQAPYAQPAHLERPLQASRGRLLAKLWLGPDAGSERLTIYDVALPRFADPAATVRLLGDDLAKRALLQSRARHVYEVAGAANRLVLMQADLLHRHHAELAPRSRLICLNLVFAGPQDA